MMMLILVASAFAIHENQSTETHELCNYIIQKANIPVGMKLPGVFMQYKNDKFNIYTPEGDEVGHLLVTNGYVAEFNCQMTVNQTYDVIIKDKETIDYILNSERQIRALSEKINSKDIDIKGINFGKDVKGFFTKLGISIVSIFL